MIEWTTLLKSAGTYLALTLVHELGHVAAAVLGGISIRNVGAALLPVPHVYVQVGEISTAGREHLFFLSGPLVVIAVLAGGWAAGVLVVPSLYLAGAARLLLDGNPFFSDFTKMIDDYRYTAAWYAHLAIWGGGTIAIVRYYLFAVAPRGVS
jgi:hypothetical protein